MKVILSQTVPGVGRADEFKEVADGYARNFLFPKHLAVQASSQASGILEAKQRKAAKEEESELREEQGKANKLEVLILEIKEKANENGLLYAAVGQQKVAEALAALGVKVDKKQIIMNPIKEAGDYTIRVKFSHGLEAQLRIVVSAQK